MDKIGFSSKEHNTKMIIDAMASQTKHTMEQIMINTEVLTSKLTEGSGKNGSNHMDIAID